MIPLLLGLFGAIFYTGNSEVRRFENLAASDIRAGLEGDQRRVRVKTALNGLIGGPLGDIKSVTIEASKFTTDGLPFFTQPELSKKGFIRELNIRLSDFTLGGLKVAKLESTIPDCRYDYQLAISKRKIRLSQSGVGQGFVQIRQEDLSPFILKKFKEIKSIEVQIANGRILVKGYGEFIIIKTHFEVDGSLTIQDGDKLVLSDTTITFDGIKADEQASQVLLKTLNPVVDLNRDLKLHGAMTMTKLFLEKGTLRATGRTKIPDQPGINLSFFDSILHL